MNNNRSKFLSLVLRHKPENYNIKIEKNGGWVSIDDLIQKCNFTIQELEEIVNTDNKQRYSFNSNKTKIRANQGHSIKNINLQLKQITPPSLLYHGTIQKYFRSIIKKGLQKMNRQYVHLSADLETAKKVGERRGNPVILIIAAREMMMDGYKFYISDNGVYLTDHVPVKYISVELTKRENV